MPESAAERSLHAQAASLSYWSKVRDRSAAMAPLRDGFARKLAAEIDPDGVLEPHELARRVDMARRAHLANASRISAKRRRERAEAAKTTDPKE
jgi:hypothetical protein